MRKRNFVIVSACIAAGIIILSKFFGYIGRGVLVWAALEGAACIILGCLMVYVFSFMGKSEKLPAKLCVLAVAILLIGFGINHELMTVKDVREGPRTTTLYVSDITSRSGGHGITGLRYYLEGTDSQGESMIIPLPHFAHEHISEGSTLIIEYYENIGRMIRMD